VRSDPRHQQRFFAEGVQGRPIAGARVKVSDKRIGYRLSDVYRYLDDRTEQPGGKRAEA